MATHIPTRILAEGTLLDATFPRHAVRRHGGTLVKIAVSPRAIDAHFLTGPGPSG